MTYLCRERCSHCFGCVKTQPVARCSRLTGFCAPWEDLSWSLWRWERILCSSGPIFECFVAFHCSGMKNQCELQRRSLLRAKWGPFRDSWIPITCHLNPQSQKNNFKNGANSMAMYSTQWEKNIKSMWCIAADCLVYPKLVEYWGVASFFPTPLFLSVQFLPFSGYVFSLGASAAATLSSPLLVCVASDDAEALQKWNIRFSFICGAEVLSAPPIRPQEDWKLNSNFLLISSQLLNSLQRNET